MQAFERPVLLKHHCFNNAFLVINIGNDPQYQFLPACGGCPVMCAESHDWSLKDHISCRPDRTAWLGALSGKTLLADDGASVSFGEL